MKNTESKQLLAQIFAIKGNLVNVLDKAAESNRQLKSSKFYIQAKVNRELRGQGGRPMGDDDADEMYGENIMDEGFDMR